MGEVGELIQLMSQNPIYEGYRDKLVSPSIAMEWPLQETWDTGIIENYRDQIRYMSVERYAASSLLAISCPNLRADTPTITAVLSSAQVVRSEYPKSSSAFTWITTIYDHGLTTTSRLVSTLSRCRSLSSCSKPTPPLAVVSQASVTPSPAPFGDWITLSNWRARTSARHCSTLVVKVFTTTCVDRSRGTLIPS